VFLVATSNELASMPPELLRKGRFDEIFFVDLPDESSRREIFAVHLGRRRLAPAEFDLDALARASDGYSGAEIEQAVVGAGFDAQHDNAAMDTARVLSELRRTRPLSVVMAEAVAALRAWADGRTVRA
jgi:SpoVK/Ycf46/Vps4 family AAA+-type ATPase